MMILLAYDILELHSNYDENLFCFATHLTIKSKLSFTYYCDKY